MNYYIREHINGAPNAGSKARNDVSDILESIGWEAKTLNFVYDDNDHSKKRTLFLKIKDNVFLRREWGKILKNIGENDTVLVQFPVLRRPILLAAAFNAIKKRGGKIIILTHDLELLRYIHRSDVSLFNRLRITFEEKSVLKCADKIIIHNDRMKSKMEEYGFDKNKLVTLNIFDYLVPENKEEHINSLYNKSVAIAGNLKPHKSSYLKNLPHDVDFELYGIGYEDTGSENIHYHGSFSPEELPFKMMANFGLVWDGDSVETCSGVYGEYLKINNPHKTSLYLAAGIPVIIWEDAALASFIKTNQCGIVIKSINDLSLVLNHISIQEYDQLQKNVKNISCNLRNGHYLKTALENCELN